MNKLIDGQKIANAINTRTRAKVRALSRKGIVPKLAIIMVGNDPASRMYVGRKQKLAASLGVDCVLHTFPSNIKKSELITQLKKIQTDDKLSGLIIQLPLPERLYDRSILNCINPELDIDFLTDVSLGSLVSKNYTLEPPTASAMLEVLRSLKINLVGKKVVVVGAGVLVGRPLAMLLLNDRATVTVCNSVTKNLGAVCREADIVITAVGKANLVRGSMLKKDAIVVDAGFSLVNGKVVGDVHVAEAVRVARFVTPTPGGVGPITVAKLLYNVASAAASKIK